MPQRRLSIDQARRIVVQSQRLEPSSPGLGKEATAQIIEHLGYVQIDTIAVVVRAHHHTLWARCPDYDPAFLHELMAIDRRVFEYWAHAIAYLPVADYRFYIPRMTRHRTSQRAWLSDWKQAHSHVLDDVLNLIRKEGALASKDFVPTPGTVRGTWWDWKPEKRALEILFWQGDLMISERRNFQKIYDLTERVLPAGTDTTRPSDEELGRFHVTRALQGLGVARSSEIREAFHIANLAHISKTLKEMQEAGDVVSLSIKGVDDVYYALPSTLDRETVPPSGQAHILSPFDNLTIQRERMKRLFGFEYTIECYLPEAKRKYGYFVLPILWKDKLIGRLDAKADRKTKTLILKKLWFESTVTAIDETLLPVSEALARFTQFNGCNMIELHAIVPTGYKRRLKTLAHRALKEL